MISEQETQAFRGIMKSVSDLAWAAKRAHGATLATRNLDHAIEEFLIALDRYRATYNQAEAEA